MSFGKVWINGCSSEPNPNKMVAQKREAFKKRCSKNVALKILHYKYCTKKHHTEKYDKILPCLIHLHSTGLDNQMKHFFVTVFLSLFGTIQLLSESQADTAADINWQQHDHISVALLHSRTSENMIQVGVAFKPEKDWHVYWQNAGDTGLPPKITWEAENTDFSPLMWPFPQAIPFSHLINYGYHHETLIFSQAQLPASKKTSAEGLPITAKVEWLVCKDSCVPGKATLTTHITPDHNMGEDVEAKFFHARQLLPIPKSLMGSKFSLEEGKFKLELYAKSLLFKDAASVEVFPVQQDIIAYSSPAQTYWKKNLLRWEQNISEYFSQLPDQLELVVVVDQRKAYLFTLDTQINAAKTTIL
ncbi:hypothetical protein TDB9533_01063 [Thalassocella blandensis]|nr:hypothetical protein TDB9533_01063 [Thalassocella blandensis]